MTKTALIYDNGSMVASFNIDRVTIFEKDWCTEGMPYLPAKSLTVYGKGAITNLRDFLDKCLQEMDKASLNRDPF